ncbi:MAG: response regulator [Vicinamibacterales bacterium]|nr:response regulator [Vicinamibacterales bacterium]
MRVLHLEDDPRDAEIVQGLLESGGITCQVTRVETRDDFTAALENEAFGLILADFSLPSFDGLSALRIALERCPDVPFIFVSGALGEELAIDALKIGATDYVLKERLSRIVTSVRRALREASDRAERKQAEQQLRRSEAFLAEGQRISSTGSFGWNVLSGEIHWSEETYKIFQHDRAVKPTLESILQRTHPDDRDFVRQTVDRAYREGTILDFEHRLLMPDDSVKHVHVIGHASPSSPGDLEFVGAVSDITDRKEAEEAVQRSERRFRAMIEYGSDGIILDGLAKGYIYVSPSTERLLGYTPEEVARLWNVDHIHPDHLQHREAAWAEVIREPEKVVTYEAQARHKDGSWRWLETTLSNLLHEPSVQAVVVNFRDITVRKNAEAEKERLEAQLRQSQKMEAIGTLAGGIAHDFNNILGAILGYGELAQKGAQEGSDVRRYLDNVMQAGSRAKSLVERILLFSRSGVGERGLINVQAVIDEALELLATALGPGVRLDRHLEAGDAAIVGDATQLHQVTMNLCTNALQAMENGGVLDVVLDCEELPQDRRLSHGNLAPGAYVRLCVSDTGSGIPPDVLERMFDPFFTTRGAGGGTGLGLSLVHRIVADLGGVIDVRTTVGRGTAFTICLPLAGEASVPSAEIATALPRGHGQTVMIVDDEKALAALAEEILAKLGYEPVGFTASKAALAAFREAPQRFDIILTDQTMPDLMGTDLAREISLLRPDIPIVLMSGYSGAPLDERARVVGVREVLRKPLQSKDIAECFGRVLR